MSFCHFAFNAYLCFFLL